MKKNRISEVIPTVLEELASGGHKAEDYFQVISACVDGMVSRDWEVRKSNDLESERETFLQLMGTGEPLRGMSAPLVELACLLWLKRSPNHFAVVYRLGKSRARAEITAKNVIRASNGRRLIGATSRAKVAKAAEAHMHLSKERAAVAMANVVNLDPGTIRRYLTELFPGNAWKQ